MKKLLIGFILGWALNIASEEYQNMEHVNLEIEALNKGKERYVEGYSGDQIDKYIERNRTKILDYINFTPDFFTCKYLFRQNECLFPSLIKDELIPLEERPKYRGEYY